MELTREEIEQCLHEVENNTIKLGSSTCSRILRQLLAEMDKPKVWDGAPEWADTAVVQWQNTEKQLIEYRQTPYTRTIPKSPEREIAEKYSKISLDGKACMTGNGTLYIDGLTDIIESAIKEALEKVK